MKTEQEMQAIAYKAGIWRSVFTRITVALCLLLLGLTVWAYISLPDTVPMNFDFAGNITNWGGKGIVWLMPAFILPVVPLTFVLMRYESVINMPVRLNERNREVQLALVRAFIPVFNACIVLVFITIQLMIVAGAWGSIGGWGWLMPVGMALLAFSIVYYIVLARRYK